MKAASASHKKNDSIHMNKFLQSSKNACNIISKVVHEFIAHITHAHYIQYQCVPIKVHRGCMLVHTHVIVLGRSTKGLRRHASFNAPVLSIGRFQARQRLCPEFSLETKGHLQRPEWHSMSHAHASAAAATLQCVSRARTRLRLHVRLPMHTHATSNVYIAWF